MTKRTWIIFIAICLLLLTGVAVFNKSSSTDVSKVDANQLLTTGNRADHIYGNKDSKVILIEYGDYQCPGCGGAFAKLQSISHTYSSQIAFVFRNLPLTSLHPNALAAATVAEAANKQGKFWEMHDLLYSSQSEWVNASSDQRTGIFEQYAKTLGLSLDQFRKDEQSPVVTDKINYDRALAAKQGYSSTPTLVLNGTVVDDATVSDVIQSNGDKLRAKLDTLIKQNGGTVPTATPQSSGGNY
jgi:protein-disulfide isomerase